MQLLFESSEEFGTSEGLGLIEGKVVAFDESKFDHKLKVPHMGWNELFQQPVGAPPPWLPTICRIKRRILPIFRPLIPRCM